MSNTYQASIIFNEDLTKSGSKIPVGIHSAVSLESVEKGETYYDVNFKDGENRVHNKRLWQPKGTFQRKDKDGNVIETPAEALAREERENMRVIVTLLNIYLGEEGMASIGASSYDEFMAKAAGALNQKADSKKVNIKLIYDNLGAYSTFSNSGFVDYIEEYVEGQEPTLKYTKWELDNRVNQKETPTVARKKDDFDALLAKP